MWRKLKRGLETRHETVNLNIRRKYNTFFCFQMRVTGVCPILLLSTDTAFSLDKLGLEFSPLGLVIVGLVGLTGKTDM